jgi:hypothetical protein
MCHLSITSFLILALISADDSFRTFCVVIGLTLSFVMYRNVLFSSFVMYVTGTAGRDNTMHSRSVNSCILFLLTVWAA